jgi:hypothetical protein
MDFHSFHARPQIAYLIFVLSSPMLVVLGNSYSNVIKSERRRAVSEGSCFP